MIRHLSNVLSRGMIVAAAGLFAAACSDSTAPTPVVRPSAVSMANQAYAAKSSTKLSTSVSKLTGSTKVSVLEFAAGVDVAVSASKVIGPEGGILSLPQTGFTLIVPRGAVSASTTFSVTPVGGRYVAYDFEPHGTSFAVPLTFMQDLSKTKHKSGTSIRGAYFSDKSLIDQAVGSAGVSELFTLSFDGLGWSFFSISHFSGYLVSMA